MGTSKSTSQSKIAKSAGKMKLSYFTNTSHIIPAGLFTDLSTIISHMAEGSGLPKSNYLYIARCRRLKMDPKSDRALTKPNTPIVQDIVNAHGSSFFLYQRPCHNSTTMVNFICRLESCSSLLCNQFFTNLVQPCRCSKTSTMAYLLKAHKAWR